MSYNTLYNPVLNQHFGSGAVDSFWGKMLQKLCWHWTPFVKTRPSVFVGVCVCVSTNPNLMLSTHFVLYINNNLWTHFPVFVTLRLDLCCTFYIYLLVFCLLSNTSFLFCPSTVTVSMGWGNSLTWLRWINKSSAYQHVSIIIYCATIYKCFYVTWLM